MCCYKKESSQISIIIFFPDSCPSQRHDTTCSGHGLCVNGQCQCDQDFKGTACNVPACPQNCEPNGDRRGICNQNLKRCDCFDGWTGESCSQAVGMYIIRFFPILYKSRWGLDKDILRDRF